jgi:hypothetical protein
LNASVVSAVASSEPSPVVATAPELVPLASAEAPCPSLAPVASDPPKSEVAPPRSLPPHAASTAIAAIVLVLPMKQHWPPGSAIVWESILDEVGSRR